MDLPKLLELYERGVITHHEFAIRLVSATTEMPTAELIAQLPPDVLEAIRSPATAPGDIRWVSAGSWCGMDADAQERTWQEEQRRWREGLLFWRQYFESGQ